MGYSNTVVIISNAEFVIQEIKNMLVLLRDIDKIECFDYFDAEENVRKTYPGAIILHANENGKEALRFLKKIKQDDRTKDIPIILYAEYPSADFIAEAFDLGISDILSVPLKDYELVIRVIWAIQKSEAINRSKTDAAFLAKLGIVDEKTGFYKKDFSLRYLETVIAKAKELKQKSCLIMIKAQSVIGSTAEKERFMQSLKASIRANDTIAVKDSGTFYVFLSKAGIDGVYSVYERLLSALKPMNSLYASVVEIREDIFDDIISVLDFKLSKAPKNGELAVVTKQDFLDMWKKDERKIEQREELGIAKLFKSENPNDSIIQVDEKTILEPPSLDLPPLETEIKENERSIEEEILSDPVFDEDRQKEDLAADPEEKTEDAPAGVFEIPDTLSAGLKKMMEDTTPIKRSGEKLKSLKKKHREQPAPSPDENREIDERNAILYKQAYAKKLTVVVEPLFKKYSSKFRNEYKDLSADLKVAPFSSYLRLNKDDIKFELQINYDGLKKVNLNLTIDALGTEVDSEQIEIDVMEFDYQKLDTVLKTVSFEYKNYLSGN